MRVTTAAGLVLVPWASAAQNVVRFDLRKGVPGIRTGKAPPALSARDTFTQITVNNISGGAYFVDVEVGTPGQKMSMLLDTGSSDAWVVSHEAPLCTSKKMQQATGETCDGAYNPDKSSTYKLVTEDGFSIRYLDDTRATGDYISDNFAIGGATIKSLQMGLVSDSGRGTGILGVGFSSAVSTTETYPNIMDQFFDQGLISSKSFSLWLNDRRSPAGTILFGGIDTNEFIGPLNRIDILKSGNGEYTAFAVAMSEFVMKSSKGETNPIDSPLPAILDSGTTLSYLPEEMLETLFDVLGIHNDNKATGLALVDCDFLKSEPDLTFTFGFGLDGQSATIVVPVHEMVLDILAGYEDLLPPDIPFDDVCVFGLQSTGGFGTSAASNFALLGDTFLRSAYVVYDLDHKEIGLAQANLNATEPRTSESAASNAKDDSIIEIKADDDGLPDVTGVAKQQTTYTPPAPTTTRSSGSGSGSGGGRGGPSGTSDGGMATITITTTPTDNGVAGRPVAGGLGLEGLVVMALAGMFAVVGGAMFVL